jgi:hypothetical protein
VLQLFNIVETRNYTCVAASKLGLIETHTLVKVQGKETILPLRRGCFRGRNEASSRPTHWSRFKVRRLSDHFIEAVLEAIMKPH